MSVYRVLVSHNEHRVGQVIELEAGGRYAKLGYLRKIEEVNDEGEPGPVLPADDDPSGDRVPSGRRGRPKKQETAPDDQEDVRALDVEDSAVSDSGPQDS